MQSNSLLNAAKINDTDTLKKLIIIQKENINQQDLESGKTILHYAIQNKNIEILDFLKKYNNLVEFQLEDQDGMTPLSLAVFQGFIEGIVILLQVKEVDVNYQQTDEFTALMIGAAENNVEACQILVQHGADVNMVGPEGTALHYSINEDCDLTANYFIDLPNIDLSIQDRFDNTVLHDIIYLQKRDIFNKIILKLESLHEQKQNEQYLIKLLNRQNNIGNNILHEAAMLEDSYYYNVLWTKIVPMGLDTKVLNVNRSNPQQQKQEYDGYLKKKQQEEIRKRQGDQEETKESEDNSEQFAKEWLEESKQRIKQREQNQPVSYTCFGIVLFLFLILTLIFMYYLLNLGRNGYFQNNRNNQ